MAFGTIQQLIMKLDTRSINMKAVVWSSIYLEGSITLGCVDVANTHTPIHAVKKCFTVFVFKFELTKDKLQDSMMPLQRSMELK